MNCDVFFVPLYIRVCMYTYLTYPTYLTYLTYGSLSKQAKPSQGKTNQLQTKKATEFPQVILPDNLHR